MEKQNKNKNEMNEMNEMEMLKKQKQKAKKIYVKAIKENLKKQLKTENEKATEKEITKKVNGYSFKELNSYFMSAKENETEKEFLKIENLRKEFLNCNRKVIHQKMINENNDFMINFQLNYSEFYSLCCYIVTKSIKTLIAKGNKVAIDLYCFKDLHTLNDLRQIIALYFIENNFTFKDFLNVLKDYKSETENENNETFMNSFRLVAKELYSLKRKDYREFYFETFNYETENETENQSNYLRFKKYEKYLACELENENTNCNFSSDKKTILNDLNLTKLEFNTFILKAKGYTNDEIAKMENKTLKTIETRVARARKKLNCSFKDNETKAKEKQEKQKNNISENNEIPCKTYKSKKLFNDFLEKENVKARLEFLEKEKQEKALLQKARKELQKNSKATQKNYFKKIYLNIGNAKKIS